MEKYKELESEFAKFIGTKYCSVCSSGTSALTLAVNALGVGDEVIVPEFNMIAGAWAVTYNRATPVFVDCGDDFNIDPFLIEKTITPKTKAIMITHIYGRPCDMDLIMGIARRHNLPVIEDACEAHGATYKGKRVGSFGKLGCFSLYKNKIIQSEEGGLITTDDLEMKELIDDVKSMAFGRDHNYFHSRFGFNFRLTNMQSEVALFHLGKIEEYIVRRAEIAREYDKVLAEYVIPRPEGSVVWVYDVLFPTQEMRDVVYKKLSDAGIAVRMFFKPMSMQPMYHGEYTHLKAYDFSRRGLYLPVHEKMGKGEVGRVCQLIKEVI